MDSYTAWCGQHHLKAVVMLDPEFNAWMPGCCSPSITKWRNGVGPAHMALNTLRTISIS